MKRKEINRLIRVLEDQGFTAEKTRKGHWLVRSPEGRVIATLAATPSDHRSIINSIARLRKAGFIWPPKDR
jgi:predicted RNA binding protein YcfA (HicA-like mRNA interferase family)